VLGLFVLALMSKPMAVTLPVVLLVLDWFPFNRIRSGKTLWAACVEKLPFLALSLASSIVTILAQKAGGTMTLTDVVPLSTRLLVAAKSIIAYLWKMLLPLDLLPFYPYPKSASLLSLEYLFPLALVVAVTTAGIMAAKKRGLLLAAWGYYVATLIPVLGIVQVGGQEMADRYTYLPSLGPFLVLGTGMAWAWGKGRALARWGLFVKRTGWVLAALAIGFLSSAAVKQIGIWKNGFTLWNYEIEKMPDVPRAYNNRGLVYEKKGRLDEAIDDFGTAIALDPLDAAAYNNRGMVFGKTGQFDEAIKDFETAIALDPSNSRAHNNLGVIYAKTGLFNKAFEQFNKTILLSQDFATAYYNRGLLYLRTDQTEAAAADFKKSCELGNDDGCGGLRQLIGG
jgi:tetratricopeptide (TPR) repeat protein